ncbi:MAG: hypothetical protein ACLFQM_01595 [Fidelibacterota bacterium]
MCKPKKYNNPTTDDSVQHYLDELSKIKLLDKYTLLRLHENINSSYYKDHQILNKISNKLIEDLDIN